MVKADKEFCRLTIGLGQDTQSIRIHNSCQEILRIDIAMAKKVIKIPRINDGPEDFTKLFEIRNRVNAFAGDVKFDFFQCDFLRPNAVAFLGGLAKTIELRFDTVEFDWNSCTNGAVMMNLSQNGFAGLFGHRSNAWEGESIPYKEHDNLDMNSIMDYLTYSWLDRGWINVSHGLRNSIAGTMWEIYNNAFEHSGSNIGVFSCGQHFPNKNELILSVIDFGQGIAAVVRKFMGQYSDEDRVNQLTGINCIKWAFESGNSTCKGKVSRGLGLEILKNFIQVNQGKLEVYSNEGYVIIDESGERYENRTVAFEGTAVHVTLRCNENLYKFRDEG